jgi:hypothetical protein
MKQLLIVKYPDGIKNAASFAQFKREAEALGFEVLGFAYDAASAVPEASVVMRMGGTKAKITR